MLSVKKSYKEVCKLLVEKDADVNAGSKCCRTSS